VKSKSQPADETLSVVIEHNWGTSAVSLKFWMENGPGERRFLSPSAVKDKAGKNLPLSVIPLRYRNNLLSRLLIRLGLLQNPWKGVQTQTQRKTL
jgi:hypothetical protein